MAGRTYWKGYLKLSLVTCPIQMMPATTEGEKLRLRTLNRATGHPVISRYVDAGTGDPVPPEDQVKGYPRAEDDYVMLEEAELDAAALESTRTIDIQTFAPAGSVGWIWYDTPYYLLPSDEVGAEAFAVIRAAMEATDRVGISRLVIGGRERAVLLAPRLGGIVLWTLRFGDEVRDAPPKAPDATPDKAALDMVGKLIKARTVDWSPDLVKDPVQDNLRQLIAAKQKPKAKTPAKKEKPAEVTGNVVSIMDALKRSLSAEKGK